MRFDRRSLCLADKNCPMARLLFTFAALLASVVVRSQTVSIPAFTGYAVPAEADEETLFSETNGLHWTDRSQKITFYFYTHNPGEIRLALNAKSAFQAADVMVDLDGRSLRVAVPSSKKFRLTKALTFNLADTGYHTIVLSAVKPVSRFTTDIRSIELSGTAAANMQANLKPRRNAASVHLRYPLPDSVKAIAFYNELTVPQDADPVHSYFMACGFTRGYFGMQVNGPTERRVIFSVWDAGNEAADRSKVPDSNKVQLLAKGEDVVAEGFGNEGTGGHSHWVYPWKAGETYRFLVTALADSASRTTCYTGYFFLPDQQKWKLIASFRAPHDGNTLRNLYSFSENFVGVNGQLQRKAFFGNQWVQRNNGSWKELTQSSFSYDATGKAGDRMDYGAGVSDDGKFYLWNGGFQKSNIRYGDVLVRPATGRRSLVDLRNADSVMQWRRDTAAIHAWLRDHHESADGEKEGVSYKIIKQGEGEQVSLADTVTVFYKGTLLDGTVFDQTGEKPATFPLKRLIRGWGIAVPECKVGGIVRMFIPSALAYGIRSRSKEIAPNSVLVFDVEVVNTKKPRQ